MEAQTSIAKHEGDGTDLERRVEEELGASVSLVETADGVFRHWLRLRTW